VKKYGSKMAMGGKTQGYDDREDERLGMKYGKMSGKDFDGSHDMREHSRRDDARFEERMADGGELTYDDFMVGDFYFNSSEGGKFKFVGKDELIEGVSFLKLKDDNIKEFNSIPLENVGREGHTYYKYIYDNYDDLDDYTIFLQGTPFDHSPNIIQNINNLINKKELDLEFEFLSEKILTCNLENGHGPMKSVYNKLFGEYSGDETFTFGAGARFIVNKKNILKREREFYLKIVEMLDKNINPIEGYAIERFHKLIFN
jgi:hypothetical protein